MMKHFFILQIYIYNWHIISCLVVRSAYRINVTMYPDRDKARQTDRRTSKHMERVAAASCITCWRKTGYGLFALIIALSCCWRPDIGHRPQAPTQTNTRTGTRAYRQTDRHTIRKTDTNRRREINRRLAWVFSIELDGQDVENSDGPGVNPKHHHHHHHHYHHHYHQPVSLSRASPMTFLDVDWTTDH